LQKSDVQVDTVAYLKNMDAIPNHHVKRAELLLLQGKHTAAEEILISNRLIWAAVDLNVRLFNWDRALGIAEQSDDPMHVQAVLWLR
jgi:intraflagellar transport protein 80